VLHQTIDDKPYKGRCFTGVGEDMDKLPDYFGYWGKEDPSYPGESKWRPLVFHSLDVAACEQSIQDDIGG
jgi:hypothetical protein